MPPVRHTLRTLPNLLRQSHPHRLHSTVSASEVSHFNALASSWWDPHGPSRLLHLMNPLRHDFIEHCHFVSPSSTILQKKKLRYLDVGCGGGIFAESAARLASVESVTGVDPTPGVLEVAKAHARRDPGLWGSGEGEGKLRYLNTSIEGLGKMEGESEEGYDVLALWEVIEHVDYPAPFLEECIRHVKPGGWLVLSTIARTWASWAVTKVLAEDVLRVVPRGTHEWGKYVDESELRSWFAKREGWGMPVAKGCVYVPGMGWTWVEGGEKWGNYFFGVKREDVHV